MNVRQISKKEYKMIIKHMGDLGMEASLPKTKNIKSVAIKRGELILIDDKPVIVRLGDDYLPYIEALEYFKGYNTVVVDKGAVKYIANGADVMRPGIVSYTYFTKNDIIVVEVEEYGQAIAVGRALVDSSRLRNMKKGKVVKNLHHIGDDAWKAARSL